MIVLDLNNEVNNWLEKLPDQLSGLVRLNLDTFEIANGMEGEILLVHEEIYNQINKSLKEKLLKFEVILIWSKNQQAPAELLPNIVNIVNSSDSHLFSNGNLLNFLTESLRTKNIMKSQLISLGQEISEAFGGVNQQLARIKKSYEVNAPKRIDESKGAKVYSKYCSGQNSSGEFFDLFNIENKIFFMMSSTTSYLLSSSILNLFTDLKMAKSIDTDVENNFIKGLKEELKTFNGNAKEAKDIELLTGVLDLSTLKFTGHIFGDFKIANSTLEKSILKDKTNSSLAQVGEDHLSFETQLERGERVILSSPGLTANWNSEQREQMIEDIVMNRELKPLDVLDEIFFQMKKNSDSGLLVNDSSAIILEVSKNVMVQV